MVEFAKACFSCEQMLRPRQSCFFMYSLDLSGQNGRFWDGQTKEQPIIMTDALVGTQLPTRETMMSCMIRFNGLGVLLGCRRI